MHGSTRFSLGTRLGLTGLLMTALLAGSTMAADFFISPSGDDAKSCANATTDACLTPNRCFHAARAAGAGNHTCFAKGGNYHPPVATGYEIKVGGWSDSQRLILRGVNGEVARFITNDFRHSTFIFNGENSLPTQFVTFSDIEIHGGVDIDWATDTAGVNGDNGCDGIVFERIKFVCPKGIGSFNADMLQTSDSGRAGYVDGLVIRDNLFLVDDTCQNGGTYGYAGFGTYPDSYSGDHPDGIHLYATRGTIVERNDFIYSNTFLPSNQQQRYAFWWKGPNRDGQFRQNYVRGGTGVVAHNKSDAPGNSIHHNVLDKAGGILHGDVGPLNSDKTYNNTVYSPTGSSWDFAQDSATGSGNELFNNLLLGDSRVSGNYIKNGPGNDSWCGRFSTFDYNLYWPASDGTKHWQDGSSEYATFSGWQSHMASACGAGLKDESNSLHVDPQLEDPANHKFKPRASSPVLAGGRGGSFSSFIGAYSGPSDSTQIGCAFNAACSSSGAAPIDTVPPAGVQGARRTDVKL